jgi:polysaccharide biosynthesis protein PslA
VSAIAHTSASPFRRGFARRPDLFPAVEAGLRALDGWLTEGDRSRATAELAGGSALLPRGAALRLKDTVDRVTAAVLLVLLAPLMAAIALLVRLDSPGPALFRQERDGWRGSRFTILKFRTMRWAPGPGEPLQAVRRDPRLTRLGGFLRRSSLDELPQLINVLRGEMSLVGPRPHAVGMRTENRLGTELVAGYALRHRMKPGITGWAQVNGCRGGITQARQLRQRVAMDLDYIEHWSLRLDLQILLGTVRAVLTTKNAF